MHTKTLPGPFYIEEFSLKDKKAKLQIWDTVKKIFF